MKPLVDRPTVQEAYSKALEIVETVGVRFDCELVRTFLKERGAKMDGDIVYFPYCLVEEALNSLPKKDYAQLGPKRVVAATPFSGAPFILDDDSKVIRRPTIDDAIKMYQINETSPLYECANPGLVDPIDNDAPNQFIGQMAMVLKYSNKYPSIGLRATKSSTSSGDVYGTARQAFRLFREFYDVWEEPVMTQGVCPNPPLTYDQECLDNMRAAIDEKQDISVFPCSLGFMTAPETIMGIVIHDFAMSLAGLTFIQLKSPGHPSSLCNFSTISNIQTLQPNYGSPECVFIQVIFYELCKSLNIPATICGSYGDGVALDYQAGAEAMMTSLLPFSLTELDEVWCYPGLLAAFACGSFHKAIADEEVIRYCNRTLKGVDTRIDPKLPEILRAGQKAHSFLTLGTMAAYRRDNYMPQIFDKGGLGKSTNNENMDFTGKIQKTIEKRMAAYELPQRTSSQIKLLQPHLPTQCRY
ncbi:MAG: trimethylamine methyltransferase family protein [Candidatus Adiutrix sp.]